MNNFYNEIKFVSKRYTFCEIILINFVAKYFFPQMSEMYFLLFHLLLNLSFIKL